MAAEVYSQNRDRFFTLPPVGGWAAFWLAVAPRVSIVGGALIRRAVMAAMVADAVFVAAYAPSAAFQLQAWLIHLHVLHG